MPEAAINRPDNIFLMDVQLPGMDRLSAVRIIQEDVMMKNIPIVALTAYKIRGDDCKTPPAGCVGYTSEPIEIYDFLPMVSKYLVIIERRKKPCPVFWS